MNYQVIITTIENKKDYIDPIRKIIVDNDKLVFYNDDYGYDYKIGFIEKIEFEPVK